MSKIKPLLIELTKYFNNNKEALLAQYIQGRLDKSLKTYYKELNSLFNEFDNYDNKLSLMRRLNTDV